MQCVDTTVARSEDHEGLAGACRAGAGLCTVVGIDGSFSRRLGAQLAVHPDGSVSGSLADSCLEAQLASDIRTLTKPEVIRYGAGSQKIDFRLPCGSGLDILLDPAPDRLACRRAISALEDRKPAQLSLADNALMTERPYIPHLKIAAFGEGPELRYLGNLAAVMKIDIDCREKSQLVLGQQAPHCRFDEWTAVLCLFHDHEWELPLIEQAIASQAFYVGAQGGEKARVVRSMALTARGGQEEQIAKIRSPVGLIPSCKTPATLALSALTEIVGQYERMRDAA